MSEVVLDKVAERGRLSGTEGVVGRDGMGIARGFESEVMAEC